MIPRKGRESLPKGVHGVGAMLALMGRGQGALTPNHRPVRRWQARSDLGEVMVAEVVDGAEGDRSSVGEFDQGVEHGVYLAVVGLLLRGVGIPELGQELEAFVEGRGDGPLGGRGQLVGHGAMMPYPSHPVKENLLEKMP